MSYATIAIGEAEQVSSQVLEFLETRKIDTELAFRHGVHGTHDTLSFSYIKDGKVVNNKHRKLSQKQFYQDAGGVKCFWNYDVITDNTLKDLPLIIVEGEMDGLSAITSGYIRVVSVPDGAPTQSLADEQYSQKYSYLDDAYDDLIDVKEIIIATDNDPAGQILRDDLAKRLGKGRCKWVKYPQGCKDLNDALMKFGVSGIKQSLDEHSFWMDVSGVYRMSEIPPSPSRPTYDLGMGKLDTHMRIRLGDFAVWSGVPGHGKSSALNHICCSLAFKHGLKTVFASFEQNPADDHKENLQLWWLKKTKGYVDVDMDGVPIFDSPTQERECMDWIDNNFWFVYPSDDEFPTVDYILERLATLILRHDAKIVVIDPWNEIEHEVGNRQSPHEYASQAIRKFKSFAKKWGVHLVIVAHPTKIKPEMRDRPMSLYDIADTASWNNRCDLGVVVFSQEVGMMEIHVLKSRYHRKIGRPGLAKFYFNPTENFLSPVPEEEAVLIEKYGKKK